MENGPTEIPMIPIPPWKRRLYLFKSYLSMGSWGVLVFLLPITVLIISSQNALPGQLLYPFKRGMERTILLAASVSPTTKALFQTNLTDRRFEEAELLLKAKANAGAFGDFIAEIKDTQLTVASVSDPQKKAVLTQQLIARIDDYQTRLAKAETAVNQDTQRLSGMVVQPTVTPEPSTAAPAQKSQSVTVIQKNQTTVVHEYREIVVTATPGPTAVAQPTQSSGQMQQNNNQGTIVIILQTQQQLQQVRQLLAQPKNDATPTPTQIPTVTTIPTIQPTNTPQPTPTVAFISPTQSVVTISPTRRPNPTRRINKNTQEDD